MGLQMVIRGIGYEFCRDAATSSQIRIPDGLELAERFDELELTLKAKMYSCNPRGTRRLASRLRSSMFAMLSSISDLHGSRSSPDSDQTFARPRPFVRTRVAAAWFPSNLPQHVEAAAHDLPSIAFINHHVASEMKP